MDLLISLMHLFYWFNFHFKKFRRIFFFLNLCVSLFLT